MLLTLLKTLSAIWTGGNELKTCAFAIHSPAVNPVEYSHGATKKDGRILALAAPIITGLRMVRDPRAGCQTERVVNAVEIYDKALLRFGQGNIDFKW